MEEKTYTINQNFTGNEVEVMSLAQLQALVKSRIEAGEDPQEVVGFVVVEYEGEIYGGITHPSHGTPSALEDGLDLLFWWNDEWSEKDYKWLWEEPTKHARNSQKENSSEDSERSAAKTLIEEIHGLKVSISCSQGWISEEDRDNRIANVVSACKDMQKEEFVSAMTDSETSDWGGELYQKLLSRFDEVVSEGYIKRREDDFPPIVSVKLKA